MTGTISGGREAGVEYIELNRPAKRHALTQGMFRLLEQRLRAAEVADEVRVIVLRSDGPVFCAGLDLDEFAAGRADEPDAVGDLNRILDTSAAVCGAIAESRKPVIVAAQGPCIGIGLLMFLSADIGLMTPSARLQLPNALIGAGYFAPLLAKLLGPRRAKALLLNPAVTAIGAADAERWGLAAAVLPAEGFRESVRDYAQALARMPAAWLQLQKAGADHLSSSMSVRDAIRAGAHLDAIAHASEFAREAAQNAFGRTVKSTQKREEENNDRLKKGPQKPAQAPPYPARCSGPGARAEPLESGPTGTVRKAAGMTLGERRERQRMLSSGDRAADARWQQILAGAAEVFRTKGYAESTLRDVAEAVGIDRASVYYYVRGKEELLVELVRGPLTDIEKRINTIMESGDSPEDKLRAAIVSHLDSYEQGWPESFVFLGQNLEKLGDAADDFAKLAKRYHASLLEIIGEGQQAGIFRSDIEARVVMYGIIGMCNWVHRWYRPGGRHTLREVGEFFASMLLDGLKTG